MRLIRRKDLRLGRRGLGGKMLSALLWYVVRGRTINAIYAKGKAGSLNGCGTQEIIKEIGTGYNVCDYDINNIPQKGAAIALCNHPTGALDGIILIDILSKSRPDVKFMGNFLLNKIDFLAQYFISVDPFKGASGKNISGIRECQKHLDNGGVLVIFPAGEVATYQKGFKQLKDKPWSKSVMRFVHQAKVPIIPICIEGQNSKIFHLAGKIHPMLRTALLPREMINKRGKTLGVNIGAPLQPRRLEELTELDTFSNYIRANVEYMHTPQAKRDAKSIVQKRKPKEIEQEELISPLCNVALQTELEQIRAEYTLFTYSNFEMFCVPSTLIPNMMMEIGRLREMTFREIGEGTNKSFDTDHYDSYYHQMFLWDKEASSLVGAYRMGMGHEIAPKYGLDGFYINSLFKMRSEMLPIMEKTLELGRSFIAKDYQRQSAPLMLLWKGILYVILKHEEYRNLVGPVTISGDFDKTSKTIIAKYLQKFHFDDDLAQFITPVTGLEGIDAPLDESLIDNVKSIELINKIVVDIERGGFAIPVLIRKYLQLNSHVLGFNVDHDFNDCLDALVMLDLKKIPEETVLMLSKEIQDIDVIARFKGYGKDKD